MNSDSLENLLRAWGHYYGERKPREWDEGDPSELTFGHPLARAMEFSGGDACVSIRSARSMRKVRGTPTWGFDPVTSQETRSHRIAVPEDIPPSVQRVQTCALELFACYPLTGTVVRFEYCKRGPQRDKAQEISDLGYACGMRVYREALMFGRGWLGARLEVE